MGTTYVEPRTLQETLEQMQGAVKSRGDQFRDEIVSTIYQQAESIAAEVVSQSKEEGPSWDDRIDDILTSRTFGYPLMLALLGGDLLADHHRSQLSLPAAVGLPLCH